MLLEKLFTIVSAVLAVAVNGSPVGSARDEPPPVRSPRGAVDVDGCKIQVLTVLFPQPPPVGPVQLCTPKIYLGGCTDWFLVNASACNDLPDGSNVQTFKHSSDVVCTGWEYVSSVTATERQIF